MSKTKHKSAATPIRTATRTESDSFGPIEVPSEALWGAQTQRSRENFRIGGQTFTRPMIRALGIVKKCAAEANLDLGELKMLGRRAQARRAT
jgi:fumarate hydratase class II